MKRWMYAAGLPLLILCGVIAILPHHTGSPVPENNGETPTNDPFAALATVTPTPASVVAVATPQPPFPKKDSYEWIERYQATKAAIIADYPDVAVAGSAMNTAFVSEYKRCKANNFDFSDDPNFPYTIVDNLRNSNSAFAPRIPGLASAPVHAPLKPTMIIPTPDYTPPPMFQQPAAAYAHQRFEDGATEAEYNRIAKDLQANGTDPTYVNVMGVLQPELDQQAAADKAAQQPQPTPALTEYQETFGANTKMRGSMLDNPTGASSTQSAPGLHHRFYNKAIEARYEQIAQQLIADGKDASNASVMAILQPELNGYETAQSQGQDTQNLQGQVDQLRDEQQADNFDRAVQQQQQAGDDFQRQNQQDAQQQQQQIDNAYGSQ